MFDIPLSTRCELSFKDSAWIVIRFFLLQMYTTKAIITITVQRERILKMVPNDHTITF